VNIEVVTGTEQLSVGRQAVRNSHPPYLLRSINPESAMAKMPPVVLFARSFPAD
jgi:hypothetical protein